MTKSSLSLLYTHTHSGPMKLLSFCYLRMMNHTDVLFLEVQASSTLFHKVWSYYLFTWNQSCIFHYRATLSENFTALFYVKLHLCHNTGMYSQLFPLVHEKHGQIQLMVVFIMTLCGRVTGYQCFRGQCCLHLQGEDGGNMTFCFCYYINTQCRNAENHGFNNHHEILKSRASEKCLVSTRAVWKVCGLVAVYCCYAEVRHNSGPLPTVHELLKWPSYITGLQFSRSYFIYFMSKIIPDWECEYIAPLIKSSPTNWMQYTSEAVPLLQLC